MKPILLLSDEPKTVRLMLTEVRSGGVAMRESETRAGCNCDRWSHPCPNCVNRKVPPEAMIHHKSKSEVTKWNT
jgi:hypothetical protein